MKHTPETLSLWDRLFNRYRKEVIERGWEKWERAVVDTWTGDQISHGKFSREAVTYRIIDRLTGSETIKKEYLN